MLTKTFSHIQGIGRETERALWSQGCETWDHYLAEPERYSVGGASREIVRTTLLNSRDALALGNHQFFQQVLGNAEAWRAWPHFRESCVYLDIETV